jgi:N-acetylmuramoyl-L-alanine amidase
MKVIRRPSPAEHFGVRKENAIPSFLILHYTETAGMTEAEDYFLGRKPHPQGEHVSAHYMVDEDGGIYQYVDEAGRAHHAGRSYWDGVTDMNSHSIGIEIVNPGHSHGYCPFPQAQMDAIASLCRDILTRHDIAPHHVLGHSDVAPGRKIDPGELFPWRELAAEGIGLWPAPLREDFEKAVDDESIRAALTAYGYDPRVEFATAVAAFQRHFQPEIFSTPERVGTPDADTAARLYALLRLKI